MVAGPRLRWASHVVESGPSRNRSVEARPGDELGVALACPRSNPSTNSHVRGGDYL